MNMKYTAYLLTAIMLWQIGSPSLACPTCIGRVEKQSPAFFSNDAYDPYPQQEGAIVDDEENQENSNGTTATTKKD